MKLYGVLHGRLWIKELEDLEGKEKAPIKWRDYEIKTLVAIRGEM